MTTKEIKPGETTEAQGTPPAGHNSDDLLSRTASLVSGINAQLDQLEETGQIDKVARVGKRIPGLGMVLRVIDSVNEGEAVQRVEAMQKANPNLDHDAIARKLIRDKAKQTGMVGASTSAVDLIPGVGSLTAITVGVSADILTTLRLQTELIVELGHLYGHDLSRTERRTAVLAVTGLGVGLDAASRSLGRRVALRLGEEYAEKSIVKVLPVIGIVGSAGINAISTEIIGNRAVAYFKGEDLLPFRQQVTRAVGKTGQALQSGFQAAAPALAGGARQAGRLVQTGWSQAAPKVADIGGQAAGRVKSLVRRRRKKDA